jgi:hypothetical protein
VIRTNITNTTDPGVSFRSDHMRANVPIQVNIDAGLTASIQFQRRVDPSLPWVNNGAAITTSGITEVPWSPYFRAQVTISAGGGGANFVTISDPPGAAE